MSEIDYPLTKPFTYATKSGDTAEAAFIRLQEPTSRNSDECAALKQAFFRAQHALQDPNAEDDAGEAAKPEDVKGADVLVMLAMAPTVDFPEVLRVGKKLFSSGVAQIDGETKLTIGLMDRMSQEDVETMLGDYLVGFILASSLARLASAS